MRVLQRNGGDLLRESEDEVEVGAVEQFRAALADPGGAGKGLALGAMAIAAGAIAEAAVAAVVALFDLAAEGSGAAALDRRHGAALGGGQRGGETAPESVPVTVEDVSHLKIGAGSPGGLSGLRQVEWTGRSGDFEGGKVQIAGGGGEAAMTEQELNGADVGAGFE